MSLPSYLITVCLVCEKTENCSSYFEVVQTRSVALERMTTPLESTHDHVLDLWVANLNNLGFMGVELEQSWTYGCRA